METKQPEKPEVNKLKITSYLKNLTIDERSKIIVRDSKDNLIKELRLTSQRTISTKGM